MNDPIGDMLTRIRNSQMRGKSTVVTPASKLRAWVLDVLQDEGYIRGYEKVTGADGHPAIEISLKYFDGVPVIREVKRVSRLLLLLFFSSVKHERYDPGEFLLWLHGYNLLCLLSYAGSCWVPCHICIYMSHLLCSKSRLTHPGHIKFHNQLSKCKTPNKK